MSCSPPTLIVGSQEGGRSTLRVVTWSKLLLVRPPLISGSLLMHEARNILLLSLLVDDPNGLNHVHIWNLYYHFRIEETSLQLLQTQAQKLLSFAGSLETWHKSKYGKLMKIIDRESLARVREMWNFYGMKREREELSQFEEHFEVQIRKSKQYQAYHGIGMNITGFRSTAPAHLQSLEDLHGIHKHYWEHGTTDLGRSALSLAKSANPMFAALDDHVILHYGTDPLLGFHLAPAYVPLISTSPLPSTPPLAPSARGLPRLDRLIQAAKMEFQAWATSFRKDLNALTLRFFIGDALAFSHSLQARNHAESALPGKLYRDRFHFEPLMLHGNEDNEIDTGPLRFIVIDTSNLLDHLGSLNLLAASAPLLAYDNFATLYTEKLVRFDRTFRKSFDSLLCGSLPTVSMLLGLYPIEFVTNTSAISNGDEVLLDEAVGHVVQNQSQSQQLFVRIIWKRPPRMSVSLTHHQVPRRIRFEAIGLGTLLYQMYLKMFTGEDVTQLFSEISMLKMQRLSLSTYQRASFAVFIASLRHTVNADWTVTAETLLELMEKNQTHLMTRNYIQEFYAWLHLLGIYSVPILKSPRDPTSLELKRNDLRDWTSMPAIVCVTLVVPREKLAIFTEREPTEIGTPQVHCIVQGPSWQNCFAAIQTGFGTIESHGNPFTASFEVSIVEDRSGWSGTSPLLVSFYAPAWFFLLEPRTATVAFGLQSTPQNTRAFLSRLGIQLVVYRTTLSDTDHVYVTQALPNQSPAIPINKVTSSNAPSYDRTEGASSTTVNASIDLQTAEVTSLVGRVEILSADCKDALQAGGTVGRVSKTPFNLDATLEPGLNFAVDFPLPLLGESHLKMRIARKSSYIELIARVAVGDDWSSFRSFLYPLFLGSDLITIWNLPYLHLDALPVIDIKQEERLSWLITHTSTMWSSTDRHLRNHPEQPAPAGLRTRLEFKDSLFSMFMHYTGLQGQKVSTFGISCPSAGGVHILFFVSGLRLDLSNRTVVLDGAVLALENALMSSLAPFLHSLQGLCQIFVKETELLVWRQVMPAYVERCRTWSHTPDCEYLTHGRIPLSTHNGEKFLCSCGNGIFPENFITDLPGWDDIARYAVRAAISPCFSAAMFESPYDMEELKKEAAKKKGKSCWACGRVKCGEEDGSLLNCAKCMEAKYCDRECQRKDWKEHKAFCKAK